MPQLDPEQLLADLTPEQAEAVKHVDGPLLVIAAAGSGKTRVLTRRVAYLISQGIQPGSVCAITFTNKAAGEMKERVGKLLGYHLRDWGRLEPNQPTICTFHSLCMRILRHYGPRIGLQTLTIFDTSDQLKVVKEALKLLDISATNFPASAILSAISNAKNKLQSPQAFADSAADFYNKQVARVYTKYQAMLESQNALDFDDLLLRTVRTFKEHRDVLEELQERFQYLLIDEYQDTNHAQYVLSAALALKRRNLCVVGDPDQSIYAWRGADIQNILDFKKDYPDAKEVKLEMNYRSTKTILAVADKLIKNNSGRIDKRLLTPNPDGEKTQLVLTQDEHDEADTVVQYLKKHQSTGVKWSQMAVFYRMNSLSRVMEDALRRASIPYVMARGTAFYDRKEIKDTLAYLRIIANVQDEVSLTRIVNTPTRGIGDTTVEKIQAWGVSRGLPLFQAMTQVDLIDAVSTRAKNAVKALVGQIQTWQKMARLSAFLPPTTPALASQPPERAGPVIDDAPMPEPEEQEDFYFDTSELPPSSPPVASTIPTPPPAETPAAPEFDLFGQVDRAASPNPPKRGITKKKAKELPPPAPEPSPDSDPLTSVSKAQLSAAGLLLPELNQPNENSPAKGSVTQLMEAVIKQSGLEAMYIKESKSGAAADTGEGPISNLNELITDATEFDSEFPEGTLDEYLTKTALVSDVDGVKQADGDNNSGAVTMMTLHAAKGLEFPVVAMIGLEEGILPHARARGNVTELEEERRLAFVGITRAQHHLMLTKAAFRTIRGLRERTITSPFLNELPQDRIELTDKTGGMPSTYSGASGIGRTSPYPAVTGSGSNERRVMGITYRTGQLVRHPTFGLGRIQELSGSGQQTRCVIDFNTAGRKTLILEYARLEPAG